MRKKEHKKVNEIFLIRRRYKHSTYIGNDEYKRVKKKTEILNGVGAISGLWMMFYPKPFAALALINTVIPIIAIYLYVKYKYIKLETDFEKDIPHIFFMTFFPTFALVLAAYDDMRNVIYTKQLWIYISIISLIILIIMLLRTEYKKKIWHIFSEIITVFIIIFLYIYGALIVTNCTFDNSKPAKYTTSVVGKFETTGYRGGGKTYYQLTLKPLGLSKEKNHIYVPEYLYNRAEEGQKFNVFLMGGRWGIKWVKPAE